jgi:hypothetical protein
MVASGLDLDRKGIILKGNHMENVFSPICIETKYRSESDANPIYVQPFWNNVAYRAKEIGSYCRWVEPLPVPICYSDVAQNHSCIHEKCLFLFLLNESHDK